MIIINGPYCVYAHINKINGKIYIGQTSIKPERRWRNNGVGYKTCVYFWNAIQKYGWENFDHEIIASNLTKSEADNFERLLIQQLNTNNSEFGYNIKAGGDNTPMSEDLKKQLSESRKGENNPMYGKHHSEETKRKIGEANKGIPTSEETKKKLSKSKSGQNHPNYGKHLSEETKEKISKSNKISKTPLKKPILQYTRDGIFVRRWECSYDIERELGLCRSNITGCCKGKYGCKTVGGFIWRYENIN